MREIIFDTETTGLSANGGDRIIEIGAVELENRFPTGRTFHQLINPQGRAVHPDAFNVHGIGDSDLVGKPTFEDIAEDFFAFVGDAILIAHNASFDMGFINAELARIKQPPFPADRVIDTLVLARRKHPMGPNSLDALCSRYNVDNAHRTKHGALLDSELLAEVYIEMNGGRQAALLLEQETRSPQDDRRQNTSATEPLRRQRPNPLPPRISREEMERHAMFIEVIGEHAIWSTKYRLQESDEARN